MFRVIGHDGKSRQSLTVRSGITVSYSMFATAGLLFAVSPQLRTAYGLSATWMALTMALGATLCAFGSGTNHWVGEFTGCPLLATSLGVLGLELWIATHDTAVWLAGANLCVLLGISAIVMARWWVVFAIYRFVRAVAAAEKGRGQ